MNFKTLRLNNEKAVLEYINILKYRNINEPYYLYDYFKVFCGNTDNLICYYQEDNASGEYAIMVGFLNPTIILGNNTGYFDFITPYGYGGPLYNEGVTNYNIELFWQNFRAWNKENKVLTEFIRFNLYGNYKQYSGEIFPTMLNIKGRILDESTQWSNFDRKVRKNYNKAIRENLSCNIEYKNIREEALKNFYDIYISTMQRTNANDSFYYNFSDVKEFIENNQNNCAICNVFYNDTCISSELVLVSSDTIYSFLGGTNSDFFDKRPNDFLKVEILNWGRNIGKQYYVLGGGYGYEDGIFKYKKSFFPNDIETYYTGRKINDKYIYDSYVAEINEQRNKNGEEILNIQDKSFFPLYNKK